MKDNLITFALVFIILLLLVVVTAQSSIIAVQNERLRCIGAISQHDDVLMDILGVSE